MNKPSPTVLVEHCVPSGTAAEAGQHVSLRLSGHRYESGQFTGCRPDGTYFFLSGIVPAPEATVIAAAHETLAALEELVDLAEQRGYHPDWLINARAAIAQARGQA